jgi:hypothetical protein
MMSEPLNNFGNCLKEALEIFPKQSALKKLSILFDEDNDIGGRLVKWIATPKGRAFLRDRINSLEGRVWLGIEDDAKGHESSLWELRECDILRWAFTAELICLGFSPKKAASFVDQGITLQDFKSKSTEDLAERRWALVINSDNWADIGK